MMNCVLTTLHKNTDSEGNLHLGIKYSDKQWRVTEYENGCILLTPVLSASNEEATEAFNTVFVKHKKTMNALK